MAVPKILLVSRATLTANAEAFKEHLAGLNVQMAVATTPEDAELARKLTDVVAQFQYVTVIVADFKADMSINDDGSTELLGYTPVLSQEPPIITEA